MSFDKMKDFIESITYSTISAQEQKSFSPLPTSLRNISDKSFEFGRDLMYFVYENWVPRVQGPILLSVALLNALVPESAKPSLQNMLKGVVLKTTEMDNMIQELVKVINEDISLVEKVKQLLASKAVKQANESISSSKEAPSCCISGEEFLSVLKQQGSQTHA